MIVSVHQPNYLPYLGFFDKMAKSEKFVLYDSTQYEKNGFQNRNKIRTKDGWAWLTVPVSVSYGEMISKIKIVSGKWNKKHWASIEQNYSKAPFFDSYKDAIKGIYSRDWGIISDLNTSIIRAIAEILSIETEIIIGSEMKVHTKSTQALLDMCIKLGADTYISGAGGREYLDENLFSRHGIKVLYQEYKHPTYPQVYDGFYPFMCVLDIIFNIGAEKSLAKITGVVA